MKAKISNIVLLISILLIIIGCISQDEPIICIDCAEFPFTQTYLRNLHDDEIFLIKGVALDVAKHGRDIKVLEDLKGNFVGKSSIFVWGNSNTSFCDNKDRQDGRIDDLTQYHKNDTLIMLIDNKVHNHYNRAIERPNDYKTIGCCFSILKLSKDYVSGYITSCCSGEELMSWDEFQILLNQIK